ncbi:MAG: chromosome segregation protein SMC [Ruminococcaceae bacterium]|nr:chromosome segregation protein SMC [Oscillospiraceae bacterium]
MVKINNLEIENVKRVKAVTLAPAENGLTVIGGKNGQGKTSVLDAIAWALGGDRFKPSQPNREGSVIPPHLRVELSNGLVVERSGNSSNLKVIDPNGNKGGQQLLNEFVEALALNLPKFMQMSNKEKADTLLRIIGVGDKLYALETDEQRLYNRRTEIGRVRDQKAKYAKELPVYSGLPAELISAVELIRQQQDILARNGENQRKRENLAQLQQEYDRTAAQIEELGMKLERISADLETAMKSAQDLHDESTVEIEQSLADIESTNTKIRANLDRQRAEIEAEDFGRQYDELTEQLQDVRRQKSELLNGADLPLEGLSVENGELLYNGCRWDCMSGSEQLRVATAIVRRLNPKCGFVLLDKLEQMDTDTLAEFGAWLEQEGLQVIATRVSTGGECSIIIEDGKNAVPETISTTKWKAGTF